MKIYQSKINHSLKLAMILASSLGYAAPDATQPAVAKAEPEKITCEIPEKVENPILSVVVADLNGDKLIDSAMLLKSGDQADFYLYLTNAAGEMELKLSKKNLVWSGAMAGTLPQLKIAKDGGLLVYSQNDSIGRNRWHQRLSVDYRDKEFIVTGYVYDERDTLDPKFSLVCDVNLLTGKGLKNKAEFKIEAQKIKLSDWADTKIPKQCKD